MDKQIVIIAELRGNQLNPVTYELLAVAQEIRRVNPWPLKVILLGADVERPARELAEASGESVLGIRNSHLEAYNGELTKDLLYEVIRGELDPVSILAAQTTRGLDFGPGLAVRLKAACITGVNALAEKGEGLCFSRAAYHGKIMTHVLPIAETTLLLVQPGAFRAFEKVARTSGLVEIRTSTAAPRRMRSMGMAVSRCEDAGLAGANVVVAAGRGVGEKENMRLIEQFAALFPRSAVAGSRPVCDMGWLEYKRQVGLTGATVSPKLYLACGISGAMPHQVGMQGAEFIVAISTDPGAPIFNIADVCIQEDLTRFIPALVEEFKKRKCRYSEGQGSFPRQANPGEGRDGPCLR